MQVFANDLHHWIQCQWSERNGLNLYVALVGTFSIFSYFVNINMQ